MCTMLVVFPFPSQYVRIAVIPLKTTLLFLLILLNRRLRNTIQISHPTLCDPSSSLAIPLLALLNLFQHTDLLQRLHDLAVHRAGCVDVVRRPRAAVLGAAVCFAEAADADALAQVDVTGDAGGADVEPVGILRGEFIAVGGFDRVDPACERVESAMSRRRRKGWLRRNQASKQTSDRSGQEGQHTGDLQLSLTLQEGRVGFDEFLSLCGRMSVSTMSLLVEMKSEHSHF